MFVLSCILLFCVFWRLGTILDLLKCIDKKLGKFTKLSEKPGKNT